jgi:cytochrome P450
VDQAAMNPLVDVDGALDRDWAALAEGVDPVSLYDPGAAPVQHNPYPYYEALLANPMPQWSDRLNAVLVADFGHANDVLKDNRWAIHSRGTELVDGRSQASNVLLFMNPPEHTRLRLQLSRTFTPRAVQMLRPNIDRTVADLIDTALDKGTVDAVNEFAYRLPVAIISDFLGVPEADRYLFAEQVAALSSVLDWDPEPGALEKVGETTFAVIPYFMRLVRERRKSPKEDFISRLLQAQRETAQINVGEIVTTCVLLYVAGYLSTANSLGNGVLALLENPSEEQRLRDNPNLVPKAVEEFLRYDTPVQVAPRTARDEVKLGNLSLDRGSVALVLIGAANRDWREFKDPNCLDINRADGRHLTFGHGIHFCLGAPLARLESESFFRALLTRTKRIERVTERLEWIPSKTQRGLRELQIKIA